MNETRMALLRQLLQHKPDFISGEALSRKLNVSRTAVWKHIEELKKEGYEIEGIRKQGYRLLGEPGTLTVSALLPYLQTSWLGQNMVVYSRLPSTQQMAHQLAADGAVHGTVVLADEQTGGKGRLGRKWSSAPEKGIWMSFVVRVDLPVMKVPQLTLLSAVAVLRALQEQSGCKLEIKWPNDIICRGRKLAGILTELSAETDRTNYVVLGIGVNVNHQAADFPAEIRHVATSLAVESGRTCFRNDCILAILTEWETLFDVYMKHGFANIKTLWEAHALSLGQRIRARTAERQYEGLAKGITEEGVLLLEDDRGRVHRLYSADIQIAK